MAGYPAIGATSAAVLGLLESAAPGTEFAGTRFEHYGADDLNDPMQDGVSLWLYRVTINTVRRSLPPREDTPIIPVGLLNHYGPEPDVFGPDEAVELVWESLSQQDIYDIWEVAKAHAQPSISYVARMVEIESTVPLHEYALVQTRELDYLPAVES